MTLPTPLRRVLRFVGIDRAVGYTLIAQGAALASRPVTIALMIAFLSPAELGYVTTFANLLMLQVYFDLGVGLATQQAVSHESAGLSWTADGRVAGDPRAKSRLASVFRTAVWWYATLSLLLVSILLPAGWYVFASQKDGVAWQWAWVWTATVSAAAMLTTPVTMTLNGCGRVADTARFQVVQTLATSAVLWGVMAAGFGLVAGAAGATVGLVVFGVWVARTWLAAFRDLWGYEYEGERVNWWREIWPFQWRIALSWPFGFLYYQLFTPVVFRFDGPEEAGRMGLSLMLFNALTGVAMSWINTKMPRFGQLIAGRDWDGLNGLFWPAFRRALLLTAVGAIVIWGGIQVIGRFGWEWRGVPIADRFLAPVPLGIFAVNTVLAQAMSSFSSYIRAHKRDPTFWIAVSMGTTMAVAVIGATRAYGALGAALACLIVNAVTTVSVVCLFYYCRRAWHGPAAVGT